MSDPSKHLECRRHGGGHATYVCQHLCRGEGRGFFPAETEGDPRPDAWCFACEQVVVARGGAWDDASEAFAGIQLLCSGCYDEVRDRNGGARPRLDVDGWCLGTRADVWATTPDLEFPADAELAALEVGELVKVLFYVVGSAGPAPAVQGERMWVELTHAGDGGLEGVLVSKPHTVGRLTAGATVRFRRDQVPAIGD